MANCGYVVGRPHDLAGRKFGQLTSLGRSVYDRLPARVGRLANHRSSRPSRAGTPFAIW